jgi:hypothetical protein
MDILEACTAVLAFFHVHLHGLKCIGASIQEYCVEDEEEEE